MSSMPLAPGALTIQPLAEAEIVARVDALAALLRDAVEAGASIGFLLPLPEAEARDYWLALAPEVAAGTRILLVAEAAGKLLGTVQLGLATKPNARHRAEVQKLLVHTAARRQGIARTLMAAIEATALAHRRTLLVLDTRQGDAAELLYWSCGYTAAGIIPHYALNSEGGADATVLFYKELENG